MDIGTLTLLILAGVVALLVVGVPFAFAAGAVAATVAFFRFGPDSFFILSSRTYDFVTSFSLTAVPMFVLMASLLERSGIARDLYAVMHRRVRGVRGGVAMATIVIALILGATTGIIGGEIVLLGLVALPQMLRLGYDRRLAMGVVCAGGSLGTMVPPSIVLIFYGINANVPIGDLFLASATPALLLAGLYAAYVFARCLIDPSVAPADGRDGREIDGMEIAGPTGLRALRDVGLPIGVALSVLGSIYMGVASITESAACGVVGVLVAVWLRGELSPRLLGDAARQTFLTCGVVLWLVFGANALIGVYNALGGIGFAQRSLSALTDDPATLLYVALATFLVLGFFVDWIGIMFLTMPVFVPLMARHGVDLVWFGVLFNMTMQIAYLTPPFGPACFYLKSVVEPDVRLSSIYAAMWPFVGLQLAGLGIVLALPGVALWLPRLVNGS